MNSLKLQIGVALGLLLGLTAVAVALTAMSLEGRRVEQRAIYLSGQFQLTAQMLFSVELATESAGRYSMGGGMMRGEDDPLRMVEQHVEELDRIAAEMVGGGGAGSGELAGDDAIHAAVSPASRAWRSLRRELGEPAGTSGGLDESTAHAVLQRHRAPLLEAASHVEETLLRLVQRRADRLENALRLIAGLSTVVALLVGGWFYARVLVPLRGAQRGLRRIAEGAFGYQLPILRRDEIGLMSEAFNTLSSRLSSLFRTIQGMGRGDDVDAALDAVWGEFRHLLPMDWVGLLMPGSTPGQFIFERQRGLALPEGGGKRCLEWMADRGAGEGPRVVDLLAVGESGGVTGCLAGHLREGGLRSALLLPMRGGENASGTLVFASVDADAYTPDRVALLDTLAVLVGERFEKGVAWESLVVTVMEGLAKLAESRDPETGDHLLRMRLYATVLAETLAAEGPYVGRIDARFVRDIYRFAPMHDIGKVGIDDAILRKPGRLDLEERREMERHPNIGAEVLRLCEAQMNQVGRSLFRTGIEIAEGHHEKFDGGGYPAALAGETIPLSARIVAVADVFDALTSRRPYKEAWPVDEALAWLREQSGGHFDPHVIDAFERSLPRIMEIYREHQGVGAEAPIASSVPPADR